MIQNKRTLWGILGLVFVVNFLETTIETWLMQKYQLGARLADGLTASVQEFEKNSLLDRLDFASSFEGHDLTNVVAVYGYSIAYYFIFPLMCLLVAWALAKRSDIKPFRVLTFAVVIDYLISLPFFLFFPVMERWTNAESGAMLLSDRVSSKLIEYVRPLSGLDNCFPSSHTSITVLVVAVCFLFNVRFRTPVLALGLAVIISTFVLGIHWLPDMIAGAAVGGLSVALAMRLEKQPSRHIVPVAVANAAA
jgi:membrane-associated phospholipid phosphatase